MTHLGHTRLAAIASASTAAAVHGLGGIGKTRLAVEFAHRHASDYVASFFVVADTPAAFLRGLSDLCDPLVLDLPEQDSKSVRVRSEAALRWLMEHPAWLLILDNVDSEEAARAVEEILGSLQHHGQVLITSRLRAWGPSIPALELDLLSEDSAVEFLLERTAAARVSTVQDEADARILTRNLGNLSLALEQAAAYVARRHRQLTIGQYLQLWRDNAQQVWRWDDQDARTSGYPRSVAVTWQTSVDQLGSEARLLLSRLAWFAPDAIPAFLMDVAVPDAPKTDMRAALGELADLSLARMTDDGSGFFIHRLVQVVSRAAEISGEGRSPLGDSLFWLLEPFRSDPADVRQWPRLTPLEPHALTVAERVDQARMAGPLSQLLGQLGTLAQAQERLRAAGPLIRRALQLDEEEFGPRSAWAAVRSNNLAVFLLEDYQLKEALRFARNAVAIDQEVLAPNDHRLAIHGSSWQQY